MNMLQRHREAKHDSVRYACEKCDYRGTQKGNLKRHIEKKHEGKIHICSQCEYKSKDKSTLKRPILSNHTGPMHKCNYKRLTFKILTERYPRNVVV